MQEVERETVRLSTMPLSTCLQRVWRGSSCSGVPNSTSHGTTHAGSTRCPGVDVSPRGAPKAPAGATHPPAWRVRTYEGPAQGPGDRKTVLIEV